MYAVCEQKLAERKFSVATEAADVQHINENLENYTNIVVTVPTFRRNVSKFQQDLFITPISIHLKFRLITCVLSYTFQQRHKDSRIQKHTEKETFCANMFFGVSDLLRRVNPSNLNDSINGSLKKFDYKLQHFLLIQVPDRNNNENNLIVIQNPSNTAKMLRMCHFNLNSNLCS